MKTDNIKQIGLHLGTSEGFFNVLIDLSGDEPNVVFANDQDVQSVRGYNEEYGDDAQFWVDANSNHLGGASINISQDENEELFNIDGDLINPTKL